MMSSIFSLPDELLIKVFSYLNVSDISLSVANVCTHWSYLVCDSILWKDLQFTVDKNMELNYVLYFLPHLTHLRFIALQWRTDTADIFKVLCSHCFCLSGINLVCCGFVEKGLVKQLSETFVNLKVFSLGKSWAVPSQCLDDIVLLTHLSTLNLSHTLLTPHQFRSISLSCKNIISINIDYVRGISEHDLTQFIMLRRNKLECLSVFGDLLTDNIFPFIQVCPILKLLHISICRNFTDTCLIRVDKFKAIKSLTLRKAVNLSSEALWKFYQSDVVKNLSRLYISAKRTLNSQDVSVWLRSNIHIEGTLAKKYCTCILTKDSFKVFESSE